MSPSHLFIYETYSSLLWIISVYYVMKVKLLSTLKKNKLVVTWFEEWNTNNCKTVPCSTFSFPAKISTPLFTSSGDWINKRIGFGILWQASTKCNTPQRNLFGNYSHTHSQHLCFLFLSSSFILSAMVQILTKEATHK